MPTATAASKTAAPKPPPVPNGDFYQLIELLTPEEKALVAKVRTYMETKVQPIINKYWADDAFPFELVSSFKDLGIGGLGFEGYGCAERQPEAASLASSRWRSRACRRVDVYVLGRT